MKRKLLSKTYLRDVRKYEIKFNISNDEYYYCVKKFIELDPFIVSNGTVLMDKNYYMLELLPLNENYTMRVYFNDKKEILEYYFDIVLGSGLDSETKIPYYDDLYNDVTYKNGKIEILDEKELEEALENGLISKKDYDLANRVTKELVNELKNKTNKYMNMDLVSLL